MDNAEQLADRIDALAAALRDAGVAPDRIATILGSAATATMNALLLDAVLDENMHADATPAPPPVATDEDQPPLRVAA